MAAAAPGVGVDNVTAFGTGTDELKQSKRQKECGGNWVVMLVYVIHGWVIKPF